MEIYKKSYLLHFNNWISLTGLIITLGSIFSFAFLFVIDSFAGGQNTYLGILTFIISPAFFILGIGMILLGWWVHRRRIKKQGESASSLKFSIDLTNASDRRKFICFSLAAFGFLVISAIGSYKTYHITESVEFCGLVCHTAMEPEYETHQAGAHARIACVECHIGSGAESYAKAKLRGLHQVYAVAFNQYNRPIISLPQDMRPASEICETCHWPEKFTGDLTRGYHSFLTDDENTPYTVLMSLKVGGADPNRGPPEGIHWHASADHTVEFVAEDEQLQVIPWIRVTDKNGQVTEYVTPDFEGNLADYKIHKMDCMDCHNRPAHNYTPPVQAVNQALYLEKLSTDLPGIKRVAVELLTGEYTDKQAAFEAIARGLSKTYTGNPHLAQTITELQSIYALNFFPKMNADWSVYPNNIGHKDWPGCFRCHDDMHASKATNQTLEMSNCNHCHSILAQGNHPEALRTLHPSGIDFEHPDGDVSGFLCSDCHNGSLME